MKKQKIAFFLGGGDLEMFTIGKLLTAWMAAVTRCECRLIDHGLGWGASTADYESQIAEFVAEGYRCVLIELDDGQLHLCERYGNDIVMVDHHGQLAGEDRPTSLEQIIALLKIEADDLAIRSAIKSAGGRRWLELVSANDRGYIPAMRDLNPRATPAEIQEIRQADRRAQGITETHDRRAAKAVAETLSEFEDGQIRHVRIPHSHTACVTDPMAGEDGQLPCRALAIHHSGGATVYGEGAMIEALRDRFPDAYWGGALPTRGYIGWATEKTPDEASLIDAMLSVTE